MSGLVNSFDDLEINKLLDDLFIDSFKQAAIALSQLTNRAITITSSRIGFLNSEDIVNNIEYQMDELYFGSIIKIKDKLDSNLIFLISAKDGIELYDLLYGNDANTTKEPSEEVVAAIGEVNNILGSTFVNCLANLLNRTIHPDTPVNNYDMLGAILEGVIMQEKFIDKKILCADTIIKEKDRGEFRSRFFIISDKDELFKLLEEI